MSRTEEHVELNEEWGAHNYHPLPVVVADAVGAWVTDVEGRRYLDLLSAYSALNHGHRHPRVIAALKAQADRCTLTSRAFHNDQLGPFLKELCTLTGYERALPMNTGVEAVETALKLARKWAYQVKGVPRGEAEILVCENNFHGRTISVVSFSTESLYRDAFAPFTPGFRVVPYGDAKAMAAAIRPNTAAILVEPIQGEGGVVVPPDGYLRELRAMCTKNRVLLIADEIQTGLGRTGRLFASQHEDVRADIVCIGKALGGGVMPISAALADSPIMGLFTPGEHGSTFGGNPLACAVAREALKVLVDEKLAERSARLGAHALDRLRKMKTNKIDHPRGKGLLIGVVLAGHAGPARPYCERLMQEGILCKDTRENVIRLAPPLVIEEKDLDWALDRVEHVLQ